MNLLTIYCQTASYTKMKVATAKAKPAMKATKGKKT